MFSINKYFHKAAWIAGNLLLLLIIGLIGETLRVFGANGKKQVEKAAIKSHLPKSAAHQMRVLLTESVQSKNWQIEDIYITEVDNKFLSSSKSRYINSIFHEENNNIYLVKKMVTVIDQPFFLYPQPLLSIHHGWWV